MKNLKFSLIIFFVSILLAFVLGYVVNNSKSKKESEIQNKPVSEALKMKPNNSTVSKKERSAPVIILSETAKKLAQIAVTPVVRQEVTVTTSLYGAVDYDETRLARITAWVGGRVDVLYIDYLGAQIEQDAETALIYSPELISAQAELIQSKIVNLELKKSTLKYIKRSSKLIQLAAYKKLRLFGITDNQIEEIIHQGKPRDRLALHAPISGTVVHMGIQEGMYVETGDDLYAIADLSHLWIICDAYESDLQWIKLGNEIRFTIEAFPGKTFSAMVAYIDPFVNKKTRTIRVRLEVDNPKNLLKPGMFIQSTQQSLIKKYEGEIPLVIPISAPLLTGTRAVVYVESSENAGEFEGRVIELGPKAGNYYIVKSGLIEGEKVVTNGNFKIDSAMQIKAKASMMNPKNQKNVIEESLPISYVKQK